MPWRPAYLFFGRIRIEQVLCASRQGQGAAVEMGRCLQPPLSGAASLSHTLTVAAKTVVGTAIIHALQPALTFALTVAVPLPGTAWAHDLAVVRHALPTALDGLSCAPCSTTHQIDSIIRWF